MGVRNKITGSSLRDYITQTTVGVCIWTWPELGSWGRITRYKRISYS